MSIFPYVISSIDLNFRKPLFLQENGKYTIVSVATCLMILSSFLFSTWYIHESKHMWNTDCR